MIAALIAHPLRDRRRAVTVESRWYPPDLAAGSTAARVTDSSETVGDRPGAPAADSAGSLDRLCAAATMIVAAGLAVAVSVVVAPRLRSASPPVYSVTSALVTRGAEVYGAVCAGCHGADLKGSVAGAAPAQGLQAPSLDATGHAWLHSDATLFRIVKYGVADCPGKGAQPPMPSFGARLDDNSISAVLAFVKSRWSNELRVAQNAFNDGESDTAETQEAVLCTAVCRPPAPSTSAPAGPNVAAR